ncbi:MAG: hypothetical protein U9N72_02420 [Bacteroidota bacterium]|nr:hypothetical protein [Bacteroidota bacterium]
MESRNTIIERVKINGEIWSDYDQRENFINLPGSGDMKIEVLIENK